MILEIRHYPDPVLRKRCLPVQILRSKTCSGEEVKEVTPETKELIKNMFETMYQNQGVGLTASQVGVLKRVVVVDVGNGPQVFINLRILRKGGWETAEEGCLSVPGVYLNIKRAKTIAVEALDENGEKFKLKAEGLLARCLQQEMDHLNGVLIIDRVGWWEKIKRKVFK